MATDLEKLVVQLSADIKGFDRQLAKAVGVSNKQFNAVERRARQMNKNLDGIFSRSFRGLTAPVAGIGAALGVNELRKMTDTWTDMNSRVALAAGGLDKGSEVMGRLGEMARRTYSDLEQTAEGYLLNATALKELGYSTDQSLDYTESLNNALVISGAKGQRAATVTDALAKAMALGKLSGDNLNTVISTGGRVAEALAAGLNTTVGGLRKLGAQGKITGNDLVKALSIQMEVLRKEAADMPATIGDGFTLLNNALLQYVGNADHATGISSKVSEALVIIADNFDTVADGALKVAGVIAGALVGRSLGGMIKTLGITGTALVSFTRALSAASSMGGVATAFGGLGAAAGPLGAIIGGALVLSLGNYAMASAEAAANTAKVQGELERMGLLAKQASDGLDEATISLDKLTAGEKARKLKELNDELERIKNGNMWDIEGNINSVIRKAGNLKGTWADIFSSDQQVADNKAFDEIARLAALLKDAKTPATEILTSIQKIKDTPVSQNVVDLANELQRMVEVASAATAAAVGVGEMPGLEDAKQSVIDLRDQLATLAEQDNITEEQQKQLEQLIDKMLETEDGADETRKALAEIGKELPNIAGFLSTMDTALSKLGDVIARAKEARDALSLAYPLGPDENKQSRSSLDPYIQQRKAGNEYESEQLRRAALGKSQLSLETEIGKVRNDALKEGITLTEQQIVNIAKANIAGNESRSSEGKKPKKEKKERDNDYERLTKSITDRTASMVAETEVQRQLNPLIDDYGYAVEKARAEQELLNAAQKAGVEVTPALRAEIGATAEQFAIATVEAGKLAEAQDKIRQNAEEMADFQKDLTRGMVDGFLQGKKAADIFADALTKIGNKLLDMAFNSLFDTGSGGGGGFGGIFGSLLGRKDGGPIQALANGGGVRGPGGPRDDKVLLWGSNGEFMVNAKATKKHRALLEAINSGHMPALRDGGGVGAMPALSAPKMPTLKAANVQGAGVTMTFAPVIDARGADQAAVDRLQRGLVKTNREMESRVIQTVRKAQKSNWKF